MIITFAQAFPAEVTGVWGFAALLVFSAFGSVNFYLRIVEQREQRLARAQASAEVAEVKTTLVASDVARRRRIDEVEAKQEQKLTAIQTTGEKIHVLVNSAHGLALRSNAHLAARIADLTGTDEDRSVAKMAAATLLAHETKQAIVDKGEAHA